MNKVSGKHISVFSTDNEKVYDGSLLSLPIEEKQIIKYSTLWFHDCEPCFIHRSAVMKRLLTEFEEYLEQLGAGQECECLWTDLPEKYKVFSFAPDPYRIVYKLRG